MARDRVRELLETANAYLERARAAEAERDHWKAECERVCRVIGMRFRPYPPDRTPARDAEHG